MSVVPNKGLIRQVLEEVMNAGTGDAAEDMLAPDFINHNPMPGGTAVRDALSSRLPGTLG